MNMSQKVFYRMKIIKFCEISVFRLKTRFGLIRKRKFVKQLIFHFLELVGLRRRRKKK